MPNRPTYPRIALPPALALRCDALRALAPTGRPSRQAVVERALAVGLDALEAGPDADEATVPGVAREVVYCAGTEGDGGPSLKTILFGHEPTPVERARVLLAAMVDRLPCLPEREDLEALQEALGAPDAPTPAPTPADAPMGRLGPALARRAARGARAAGFDAKARKGVVTVTAPAPGFGAFVPAPNDPRWALDAAGNYYACESHTIGAMAPNGRRVEVAVVAGDTLTVVRQTLAAAAAPTPLPIYLTTPETAPWAIEVGQATVTSVTPTPATAEDEAAAEAVNRGRPDGRVRTRVVG